MKTSAKYYHLTVGTQGQVKLAKKFSTYDVTHKKHTPPNKKIFFRVQTTSLATSFDTSTRSVTHTGAEIFPHKATSDPAVFLRTAWINPDVKVLRKIRQKWANWFTMQRYRQICTWIKPVCIPTSVELLRKPGSWYFQKENSLKINSVMIKFSNIRSTN